MPTEAQIRAQALQLSRAAVPTLGSVNRQYRRSESDVGGFTRALVEVLRAQVPGVTRGYQEAITQQQGLDKAAAASLGDALGPDYQGAKTTVQARGTNALSNLLQRQAAENSLAVRQPGWAADRGFMALSGLEQQRQDALANRRDALRQAFTQAYQQVHSNAYNEAMGLAQLGLSGRQLAEQRREFGQTMAYNQRQSDRQYGLDLARLQQSDRQFNAEQRRLYAAMMAQYGAKGGKRSLADKLGMTPTQISSLVRTGAKYLYPPSVWNAQTQKHEPVKNPAQRGAAFTDTVDALVHQFGLPQRLAVLQTMALYKKYQTAPKDSPAYAAYSSYFDWITNALERQRIRGGEQRRRGAGEREGRPS